MQPMNVFTCMHAQSTKADRGIERCRTRQDRDMYKSNKCIRMNAKDSIFTGFFRERSNVFDLYRELHPEDLESSLEDVTIRTVKHFLSKGYTNDLGFSVGDRLICLVEAQGYRLKAMNLRTMFYLSETFQSYLNEKKITLYNIADSCIPRWEAYVVRTGEPNEGVFRLMAISDELLDNSMMNAVPMGKDTLLSEYIRACHVIDNVIREEGNDDHRVALQRIVEECRESCGRIGEFIWSRRHEIMGIYEQMFDDEENMRMLKEAYREEGLKEGREAGLKEGREEGREEGKADIVRVMVSKGMSPEEVANITDLPLEDVVRMASEDRRSTRLSGEERTADAASACAIAS